MIALMYTAMEVSGTGTALVVSAATGVCMCGLDGGCDEVLCGFAALALTWALAVVATGKQTAAAGWDI